jgi:hypothetical protein
MRLFDMMDSKILSYRNLFLPLNRLVMDEFFSLSGDTIEPLASILSHIVVYFDCDNALKPHRAVDIQFYFQNSEN